MSEDRIYDKIHRGARAKALLDDELLKECFDSVGHTIIDRWKKEADPIIRERLWNMLQGMDMAREAMVKWLNAGKVAQHELNELIAKQERAKNG